MKNIVLRARDGMLKVSAPLFVSKRKIEKFIFSKEDWIEKALLKSIETAKKIKENNKTQTEYSNGECLVKFKKLAKNVFPLVKDKINFEPKIFVKDYKSRFGTCYFKRGYIILSKTLFDKSDEAIEQVILHEFVHFLVQNHGKKFHETMKSLMPDYKERRKLL